MPPSRNAFQLFVRAAPRVGLILVLGAIGVEARGAELAIFPAAITLDGSNASQRVLVEETDGTVPIAEATAKAQFAIDRPNVARITPDGTITPVGNGKVRSPPRSEHAGRGRRSRSRMARSRRSGASAITSFRC